MLILDPRTMFIITIHRPEPHGRQAGRAVGQDWSRWEPGYQMKRSGRGPSVSWRVRLAFKDSRGPTLELRVRWEKCTCCYPPWQGLTSATHVFFLLRASKPRSSSSPSPSYVLASCCGDLQSSVAADHQQVSAPKPALFHCVFFVFF